MNDSNHAPRWRKRSGLTFGLLLVVLAHAGLAEDQAQTRPLPRVFQQAKLGMTTAEVVSVKPNIAVTKRTHLATVSMVETPSDRYVQHVAYRFHDNTLYEIEIRYRPERLQNGASGLLARLKEQYGPPAVDRVDELDLDSGDISRRQTVWRDAKTKMTLLERHYLHHGNQVIAITLTLTDLVLAQLRDEAQNRRVHQKLQEVPIPMPDVSSAQEGRKEFG